MRSFALVALLSLGSLVACDSGHTSWELTSRQVASSGTGGSTVQISVTDAPFPYDALRRAVVAIRRIEIRDAAGVYRTLVDFGEDGLSVDLIPLRNGIAERLAEVDLAPGAYDAIRVWLDARELVVDDAGTTRRFVEFARDDGALEIRLDPPLSATADRVEKLLLDLDLARSFVVQSLPARGGGIAGFRFEPRLRAASEGDAGSLTFRVASDAGTPADSSDDRGLLGAEVTLSRSGDDGVAAGGASGVEPDGAHRVGFVLHRALPAGDYDVRVAARDHEPYETSVTIVAGERTDLGTITLAKRPVSVRGTVFAEVGARDEPVSFALPLARVEASFAAGGGVQARDRANAYGEFELTGLVPGEYVVRVEAIGFAAAEATVVVETDVTAEVDLVLRPAATDVTGTVRDEAGNVAPNAIVRAVVPIGPRRHVVAETTTDDDGVYELADLPTGVYAITAETDDGSARRWLVLLGREAARTVDLTLR